MISIGISTVDELLKLGGKITDLVMILLTRRGSKEEQEQIQAAVEQFNRLKQTHLQVRTLVEEYNRRLGQAVLQGGVQTLFPLCTHQGFKEVEQLYAATIRHQVSYQELVAFELLSAKTMTHTLTETGTTSDKVMSQQWAEAYTYERWITLYQTGARSDVEVINRYQLIWQENEWKVHKSDVFKMAGQS